MSKNYIEDLTEIMLFYFEKNDLYNASIINKQIEALIEAHTNHPTQNKKQLEEH